MNNPKPKVELNTSTDLHFDLLADPTKIKPQKKNISLTNINETEDGDSHVIDKVDSHSDSKSRSSKSSRSNSDTSRSSKGSKSSKRSFVANNSIPFSGGAPAPAPAAKPNFFTNFFGSSVPKPVETSAPAPNYSFPSNVPKDNYDSLPEDQKRLKRLQKFAELKYIKDTYHVILTKEFSYNSDYHEMCAEIEFHRANISKKNSVEFFKSMVFGSVGMVDKLNKMFDPFGLKDTLDGFPEHLKMTTGDSEIYEELADKYKNKFKEYSVEVRFMLLIVGSAAGFIAAKKASESIPFFNNLDPKTKEDLVRNLSQNIQANVVPASAAQKQREEQNKILHYMMQQKQAEEEKAERMNNILRQNEQSQRIMENLANNKNIDKKSLITSSIDSDDSTIKNNNATA
jgi:hypothetical protein